MRRDAAGAAGRGWRLGLWVGLAVLVVSGLMRLRFDASPLALLPGNLPVVEGLKLHQAAFPAGRELIVVLEKETAEEAEAWARTAAAELAAERGLARSVRWRGPDAAGLAENVAWMWMQRDPAEVLGWAEGVSPGRLASTLAAARERLATSLDPGEIARAGYDPLGLLDPMTQGGWEPEPFASADGRMRVLLVEPSNATMNWSEASRWMTHVRLVVLRGGKGRVRLTGGPAFMAEVGAGMESDLRTSVAMTLGAIGLLFWLAHRSFRPLGLLVASLALTLVMTLALGGLVLGTLSVISCGFAAVMLGLVVDYGLVAYQELRAHPGLDATALRRAVLPGIAWSAVTTAGTFLSLRFAGLPGLAELGTLTAIGLGVGAVVMVGWFLPKAAAISTHGAGVRDTTASGGGGSRKAGSSGVLWGAATALLVLGCVGVLVLRGWPRTVGGAEPLRPRNSAAYETMADVQRALGRTNAPAWLLFRGRSAEEVAGQMSVARERLERMREDGAIGGFELPERFWPRPARAASNAPIVREMAGRIADVRRGMEEAGFRTNALALLEPVFAKWSAWTGPGASVPVWPTNEAAGWLASMVSARDADGGWIGLGTVSGLGANPAGMPPGTLVTGWERLGPDLLERVRGRVAWLTGAIGLVLAGCLWLAFRRWTEVLLGLGALGLSFAILLAVMSATGATWNLLNLVAIPLVLGTSVDSTIHVQLAMRRHRGDLRAVWRSIGVALLLCAGANVAGFGSLAWSSNAGLASLDVVCAGGVLCVLGVSLGLLPRWWQALHGGGAEGKAAGPSSLYAARVWGAACRVGRWVPRPVLSWLARAGAWAYRRMRPERFRVVVENLLPVCGGDRGRAEAKARANFGEFAEKLVDLWRFESGVPGAEVVEPAGGWDAFHAAVRSGRGVVLVTPHLGNWELGGPLLASLGVKPLVLTAPEPAAGLTEVRARARALQGIETLVVGADPFAFVEVIRRLQSGGVVALLVDRPVAGGVEVESLGRRMLASPAAAELARATGCVVLPVCVVREGGRARAYAGEPIAYERAALGTREARREFTGRIVRALEPWIRQFPDQWFHFVPVWKEDV